MADTQHHVIGVMDPNSLSFRVAFEGLMAHLKPEIEWKGKKHTISTRRIICRPYETLGAKSTCDAIINRGAHWNPHHNSFFTIVMHYVYLLNDMVSFRAIDKNTGYGQMHDLGMSIPRTWAIPPKDNSEIAASKTVDSELVFSEYELFDLHEIGEQVGYPAFLKPQDGGGWVGVVKVDDWPALKKAYDESGAKPMNLQQAIDYKEFIRTVGVGPQMMPMHYNATSKFSHDRYMRTETQAVEFGWLPTQQWTEVQNLTKIINAFYGWSHNSCEALWSKDGKVYPIDFCNAYPDSTLISLHFYFPDLVKAMARWLTYVVVTGKKKNPNYAYMWPRYFEIRDKARKEDWSYEDRIKAYVKLADEHFETEKFNDFMAKSWPEFEEKAHEFFASDKFLDTVLEPDVKRHFKIPMEVPPKIVHYTGIHKFWVQCDKQRLGGTSQGPGPGSGKAGKSAEASPPPASGKGGNGGARPRG